MEKRMLLRFVKAPASDIRRSARVWRITKGVLNSETGKIRVRLYTNGKVCTGLFAVPLLADTAAADEAVRLWVRHGMPYTPKTAQFLRDCEG